MGGVRRVDKRRAASARANFVFKRSYVSPHACCIACALAAEPCEAHTHQQTVSLTMSPARPHKVITHQLADLRAFDEIMAEAAGRCARCRRSAQTIDEDGLHFLRR